MKVSIALTLDMDAQSKMNSVNGLFKEINDFIANRKYGNGLLDFFIIVRIINPPSGFEHLHKDFKPKYIEHKSLINKLTGEPFLIEKQFSYSIKIQGELFNEFSKVPENESRKILASEILKSLSNLETLPKKVKDFDKEKFKSDMEEFFKERNLL